jgi:hypothetical protein
MYINEGDDSILKTPLFRTVEFPITKTVFTTYSQLMERNLVAEMAMVLYASLPQHKYHPQECVLAAREILDAANLSFGIKAETK